MSIANLLEKVKPHGKTIFTALLLVILTSIFLGLGKLSALQAQHRPIKIENPSGQTGNILSAATQAIGVSKMPFDSSASESVVDGGQVIGSKSGKKYYFPWCGTVKRIKPENQVHFASIEAARAAGFTPGGNCKGLK